MGVTWSRGFFRLWLVIALLWVIPFGALAVTEAVRDLWPVAKPATLAVAERAVDKACSGFADALDALGCKAEKYLEAHDRLTADQRAAEAEWRDAYQRRERLLSNFVPWVSIKLALIFGPPLILLLPGLVVAWIGRGFTQNPN